MAPIAPGVKVAEIETLLLAEINICHSSRYLTSDEGPSSSGALVVKQDTITRIHPIGFPVVDGDPKSVELGNTIGRTRVKWGGLGLWCFNNLSVQFRGGSLVETDVFFESTRANCVEETEGTQPIHVASVFGHLKRDLDV